MTSLQALKDMPISFPGLFGDWEFNPDPIAIHVGHGIYWYGIILAAAMLAGLLLCMKQAKRYGIKEDHVLDMVLWAVPSCIIGSRIYYVIFNLELYRNADGTLNWGRMVAIWDGGLAIYGTVIVAVIVVFFYTRHKKLSFFAMTDLGVLGLILGQIIGRWANFINREAFGGLTDLPWRMRLWVTSSQYIEVHPTFLYESLWNLVGLGLLCAALSLIAWPAQSAAAVREGMALCANVVVPSLFPFFVLASLVVELGLSRCLGRLLHPIMAPLFRVALWGAIPWGPAPPFNSISRGSAPRPRPSGCWPSATTAAPPLFWGRWGPGCSAAAERGWPSICATWPPL